MVKRRRVYFLNFFLDDIRVVYPDVGHFECLIPVGMLLSIQVYYTGSVVVYIRV